MTRLGWIYLGVAMAAVASGGCAVNSSTGTSGGGTTTAGGSSVQATTTPSSPLSGSAWTVEEIGGQAVLDQAATSLRFDPDGRVSGSTGCNGITGAATIDGSRITFSPLATTRRACADSAMAQETRFLEAMAAVRSYTMDDDGAMRLLAEDGRPLARLARAK
jgi:heat shock protein HslJ